MACDLWLWLKLQCRSRVWVAELVLVEQSAHADLAWDGDFALKYHVETITGSRGTMQQLWQHLDRLKKSRRKPGRGWEDFSLASTVIAPGCTSFYGAWQARAFCTNGSSSLVATRAAVPPASLPLAGVRRGRAVRTSKDQMQPRAGSRKGKAMRSQSTGSPGSGFVCWCGGRIFCK